MYCRSRARALLDVETLQGSPLHLFIHRRQLSIFILQPEFINSTHHIYIRSNLRCHRQNFVWFVGNIDLYFPAVVVDSLGVLEEPPQVLYVGLQEHLPSSFQLGKISTSTKGRVRLNRSQMSIIFTYEVLGRAFETLMNLEGWKIL